MLKKLSYNRVKLFQFLSSLFIVCAYLLEIVGKGWIPEPVLNTTILISLLVYLAVMGIYAVTMAKGKGRVMMDEMSKRNEAKASQYTYVTIVRIIVIFIPISRLAGGKITLSVNVLMCVLIGMSMVRDGFYLYFERGGGKTDADSDD